LFSTLSIYIAKKQRVVSNEANEEGNQQEVLKLRHRQSTYPRAPLGGPHLPRMMSAAVETPDLAGVYSEGCRKPAGEPWNGWKHTDAFMRI
jgi:hypothetical protein